MQSYNVRRLVESAILIAIGTVLSMFSVAGPWVVGGSVSICAVLPLIFLAERYGTRWGLFSAFAFSVLQLVLGVGNVQYATNAGMVLAIVLLDYIIAYSMFGFAAAFNGVIPNRLGAIITGTVVTFLARLFCHFLSGVFIWEALWPNELGWPTPLWSIAYNASYVVPEMLICIVGECVLFKPLKKYWLGEDLKK